MSQCAMVSGTLREEILSYALHKTKHTTYCEQFWLMFVISKQVILW